MPSLRDFKRNLKTSRVRKSGIIGISVLALVIFLYSDGGLMRISYAQPSGFNYCYNIPNGNNNWNLYTYGQYIDAGWYFSPAQLTIGSYPNVYVCKSVYLTSSYSPSQICSGNVYNTLSALDAVSIPEWQLIPDYFSLYPTKNLASNSYPSGDSYSQPFSNDFVQDQYPSDGFTSQLYIINWIPAVSQVNSAKISFNTAVDYGSSCTNEGFTGYGYMTS